MKSIIYAALFICVSLSATVHAIQQNTKIRGYDVEDYDFIEIPPKYVNQMSTLVTFIQDNPYFDFDQVFIVHQCSQETLRTLVTCLEFVTTDINSLKELLSTLKMEMVYNLMIAANYLDIPPLLIPCCWAWGMLSNLIEVTDAYQNNKHDNNILQCNNQLPYELHRICVQQLGQQLDDLKTYYLSNTNIPDSSHIGECYYSPNGKYIASPGLDDSMNEIIKIYLFDQNSHQLKYFQTLNGHQDEINAICWSPDSNYIASGSCDNTIKIWSWNVKSSQFNLYQNLNTQVYIINEISWSPNGDFIAAISHNGNLDGTITIWTRQLDDQQFKLFQTIEEYTNYLYSICWSPDGNKIVHSASDKTIKIWSLDPDSQQFKLFQEYKKVDVDNVYWSPDGNYIYSIVCHENHIKAWDWNHTTSQIQPQDNFINNVTANELCFSPDGMYLITTSTDTNFLIIWSLINNYHAYKLAEIPIKGIIFSICWSSDGNYLALGTGDCGITIIDTRILTFLDTTATLHHLHLLNIIKDHAEKNQLLDLSDHNNLLRQIFDSLPQKLQHLLRENGSIII